MKTDKILFSKGGIDNSTGVRGGQISHKICGMYEPLILNNQNVHSTNKIVQHALKNELILLYYHS